MTANKSMDELGAVLVEQYAGEWKYTSGDPCQVARYVLYQMSEDRRKLRAALQNLLDASPRIGPPCNCATCVAWTAADKLLKGGE